MNVMLDIETMGNGSNSAIIAIGAVAFGGGEIHARFYREVSLKSSCSVGLECDASTIIWWMGQSEEARSAFKNNDYGMHIEGALVEFAMWFNNVGGCEMWGNGAAFDNAILSNAYLKCGINKPWDFWNDRCYRTVKALHPEIELVRVGTHHNAVDDAESQAMHLMKMISV